MTFIHSIQMSRSKWMSSKISLGDTSNSRSRGLATTTHHPHTYGEHSGDHATRFDGPTHHYQSANSSRRRSKNRRTSRSVYRNNRAVSLVETCVVQFQCGTVNTSCSLQPIVSLPMIEQPSPSTTIIITFDVLRVCCVAWPSASSQA